MKHPLLKEIMFYGRSNSQRVPNGYLYNRPVGGWTKSNTQHLLIHDKKFIWAATKRKDITLSEDMK